MFVIPGAARIVQLAARRYRRNDARADSEATLRHAHLPAQISAPAEPTDSRLSMTGSANEGADHGRRAALGPDSSRDEEEGRLTMWAFLSARLRTWRLLAIALPVARLLVHRHAVTAERHDPSTQTAKLLRRADPAVTAVYGRFSRRVARW